MIDINKIIGICEEAGAAILEVYKQDFEVFSKEDASPLTMADKNANDIIVAGLKKYYPEIPIISEENKQVPYEERKNWSKFWLVDPLDGTKEFIKKNDEFTVNIALIENGAPVAGVVYLPVNKVSYYGIVGEGSYKKLADGSLEQLPKNPVHYQDKDEILVVASRSHMSDEVVQFIDELKAAGKTVDFVSAGSSLKFCLVAEGTADVYPRLGPTMEWDTGAAHAVALGAGRNVLRADTRQPLTYNKENLLNPWFIVE